MISAKGYREYLECMHRAQLIYMWGADVEVGTKELLEKKIKTYGKENYTELTAEEIEGKLCADCSGLFTPLSGKNITAENYYNQCEIKGKAKDMPRDKVCQLFRQEGKKIVHVAGYLGNGYLVEMFNGCEKRAFNPNEWTYYGIPTWIEKQPDTLKEGGTVMVYKEFNVYNNAYDAQADRNRLKYRYGAGLYYVYKIHKPTGAVNLSLKQGVAGAWVLEKNIR